MGGDGGSTTNDRRFLRAACGGSDDVRPDKVRVDEVQKQRARICALSSEPLVDPIVACELGDLYNKDVILSILLDKTSGPNVKHIRSMKDVKQVISMYPSSSSSSIVYVCPVTQMEFTGLTPFVLIWTSGSILSEKAIREIGIEGLQSEYGPFTESDIIPLIPLSDAVPPQMEKMNLRREQVKVRKSEKKEKKEKKEKDVRKRPRQHEEEEGDMSVPMPTSVSVSSLGPSRILSLTNNTGTVTAAAAKVLKQKEGSSVYLNLFHNTTKEKGGDSKDLFTGTKSGVR